MRARGTAAWAGALGSRWAGWWTVVVALAGMLAWVVLRPRRVLLAVVLVLGGADAGLDLDNLSAAGDVRVAFVRAASPGVRFLRIPAAETPVVARDADEGAL